MTTTSAPGPGTILGDRYEIRRLIGTGSMGAVYRGCDIFLSRRPVAIKILAGSAVTGPMAKEIRERFCSEAKILSVVTDDNVVQILNSGFTPADDPYLVMEYLDGQDLESVLREARGPLSIERSVAIALGMCAGVHACHHQRIIHRDLKPANVFLQDTGRGERVKVLDFSVSKALLTAKQSSLGFVVGTPEYMAPEHAQRGQADEKSDQYAIALILYRCLTGSLPHGILPTWRQLRSQVPKGLYTVLVRALDFEPKRRFETVHHLGQQLRPFGSLVDQAGWLTYYTSPPRIKPQLSGPIPPSAEAAHTDGGSAAPIHQGIDAGTLTIGDSASRDEGARPSGGTVTPGNLPMPAAHLMPGTVIDRRRVAQNPAAAFSSRKTLVLMAVFVVALAATGGAGWQRWARYRRSYVGNLRLDQTTAAALPPALPVLPGGTKAGPVTVSSVVASSSSPAAGRARPATKRAPRDGKDERQEPDTASDPAASVPAAEAIRRSRSSISSRRTIADKALAEVVQGRWLEAEGHLIDALDAHDAPWLKDPNVRERLERGRIVARAHLGFVKIVGTVGAEIFVNGRPIGTLPLGRRARVPEGKVEVVGTSPSGRRSMQVEAEVKGEGEVTVEILFPPLGTSSSGQPSRERR